MEVTNRAKAAAMVCLDEEDIFKGHAVFIGTWGTGRGIKSLWNREGWRTMICLDVEADLCEAADLPHHAARQELEHLAP